MAAPGEFAEVSAVLAELAPPDADIRALEVRQGDAGRRIVTVQTRTAIRLMGRRGTTADALRAALAEHLDDEHLQLNILEAPDDLPPDQRPPEGPSAMYPP